MTAHGRQAPPRQAPPIPYRRPGDARIGPMRIVEARELGGWAVVDAETLRVVEPGYLWWRREQAIAWARREMVRQQREAMEYRRRQEELARRGLPD